MNKNITIVTGLWDLGRGELNGCFKRNFQDYKNKFLNLLKTDCNMAIWIPKELEEEVWNHRHHNNTVVYIKNNRDFETWFPFFKQVQKIRENKDWQNISGWLAESPQAALPYYNPMMMSKMFMVHDTKIFNPFESDYYFWLDGGIINTVSEGYFIKDKILDKLDTYCDVIKKMIFLTFPYSEGHEIHGFERKKMEEYCNGEHIKYVARGGFWGGHKTLISEINARYYEILNKTLNSGYMGADECLFTILCYRYPNLINRFEIEKNGLVWPFFESLKRLDNKENKTINIISSNKKEALYVISYNSPKQFKTLCESFKKYDSNFLNKPQKFLLNNSLNRVTDNDYADICKEYEFEEIRKDNIGICGGRQFIAEHANENEFDYHMFFEDDMFFYLGKDEFCKNGFRRKISDLYDKILEIMKKENFDFLKFNFTEFFGDNVRQWAWHNVPQTIREKVFPEKPIKNGNEVGNEPFLKFKNIKSYKNLPYATGDIYYCNWPQIVSKDGNKKMFLKTKWPHPYEQTWMSYIYQETLNHNIYPGILLATPTEHNRFEHYKSEERKEN